MALIVKNVERVFILKRNHEKDDVTLPDPNNSMTPVEVMKFYSGRYPELTSGTVTGPVMKKGQAVYQLETVIGDKG